MKKTERGIDSLFSFFNDDEKLPYLANHKVIAQFNKDACVAACCRMILNDSGLDAPESYLASALQTKRGAFLSRVPQVLKDFRLENRYQWRSNLVFEDLQRAIKCGKAIVSVKRQNAFYGHALIVDDILDTEVRLRDSLPIGQGTSYAVNVENFLEVWLSYKLTGSGVIYVR